jgi:Fur family ferric uptake transcriptional regulator
MDRTAALKAVLKRENLRYTPQRKAVWDELCSSDEHRNAEDIYLALRGNGVRVSRATVYRTIDVLVRHGMVRKLDLGEGRSRYEHKLDPTHHDHLICINCGQIVEFVNTGIERLQEEVARQHQFQLKRHIHQLFGLCRNCQ